MKRLKTGLLVTLAFIAVLGFGYGLKASGLAESVLKLFIEQNGTITFEGSSVDGYETTLAVTNPTADRTFTFPNVTSSDVLVAAGTQTVTGTKTFSGAQTFSNDVTVSDISDGGDQFGGNRIEGLLKFAMVDLQKGTNATNTVALDDDSPAGEFAATDADVTCTTSNTHFKAGSNSLKLAVTTAADDGDGCNDTGLAIDATADESIGGWVYSSVALAAGDLHLVIVDPQLTSNIDLPAIPANTWTFVDLTTAVTAIADANKNGISDVGFKLSAAGATKAAAGAFDVWIDAWYKWDAADEVDLGYGIIRDGVYGILGFIDAAATADNTVSKLALYTNYFVCYTDSNEKIVWIGDNSTTSNIAFIAYTAGM